MDGLVAEELHWDSWIVSSIPVYITFYLDWKIKHSCKRIPPVDAIWNIWVISSGTDLLNWNPSSFLSHKIIIKTVILL